MGLIEDSSKFINSLANLKKADADQIKAKTQNRRTNNVKTENKKLRKALSKSNRVGIISIVIAVAGIITGVLLAYFPIHNTP